MKGKKYPVQCVSKDTVVTAAKERKFGGRANIDGVARKVPTKEIGVLPDGPAASKHAGKMSRKSVHGKPLMSSSGMGKKPPGHKETNAV